MKVDTTYIVCTELYCNNGLCKHKHCSRAAISEQNSQRSWKDTLPAINRTYLSWKSWLIFTTVLTCWYMSAYHCGRISRLLNQDQEGSLADWPLRSDVWPSHWSATKLLILGEQNLRRPLQCKDERLLKSAFLFSTGLLRTAHGHLLFASCSFAYPSQLRWCLRE